MNFIKIWKLTKLIIIDYEVENNINDNNVNIGN